MPNSAVLSSRTFSCWAETGSATGLSMSVVGHVVVRRRHGQVGPAHRAPGQAQPVEGLGRGHLVDEVQVDEEEVGLALGGVDDVGVPDLLAERARRPSAFDGDDVHLEHAARRLVLDGVAGAAADQDLAEGRAGRDHRQVALPLLDGAHEELLGVVLVVTLVAEGRPCCPARRSRRPAPASSTISTSLSIACSWRIARLHLPLGVLGGVVVAVLAQVAQRPGRLDGLGDLDPARGWSGPRARPPAGRRWPGSAWSFRSGWRKRWSRRVLREAGVRAVRCTAPAATRLIGPGWALGRRCSLC